MSQNKIGNGPMSTNDLEKIFKNWKTLDHLRGNLVQAGNQLLRRQYKKIRAMVCKRVVNGESPDLLTCL